ncbi:MAG TPA: hypothetical protein VGS80_12455 [Ktedonobacterales bacterium]|nr:hypothetical protein [Ktedonobacterales bacterium]
MDRQRPELDHEPAPETDDLHIEVGELDLPAHLRSARLAGSAPGDTKLVPWYRQRAEVPRPVVAAGVLALVVLAAVAVLPGRGQQLAALFVHPAPTATTTQPAVPTRVLATPTPSPFPTPTLVAPPIGAMPDNCAPSPTGPPLGGGHGVIYAVGAGPVWVDGFDGATAFVAISRDAAGPYSEYGWPVYTALALKVPFEEAVTLRGSDLRTGAPLWFTLTSAGPETGLVVPLVTVDPRQSIDSIDSTAHWWNGLLYLPGAGCYTLQASWRGGGWTVHFAAGR